MRFSRNVTVFALAVAAAMSFAPLAKAAPSPTGVLCGFVSASDPQLEGAQTGEVDAGPLFWTDDTDPAALGTGSITCTIQVNASTHAGSDACAVTGPETAVVGFAAGTCTYAMWTGDNVFLCTEVTVDGTTLYYNSSNDPLVDGSWSTSNTASCSLATSASAPGGRPAVYPSGTITITPGLLGGYQYSYTAFNPPLPLWDCPTPSGPSASCTPPTPPRPARNRCGIVSVQATTMTIGFVGGTSRCSTGAAAWAPSTGPHQPGADAKVSEGSFEWTCSVDHDPLALFKVTCHVGQGTSTETQDEAGVIWDI